MSPDILEWCASGLNDVLNEESRQQCENTEPRDIDMLLDSLKVVHIYREWIDFTSKEFKVFFDTLPKIANAEDSPRLKAIQEKAKELHDQLKEMQRSGATEEDDGANGA